MIPGIGRAVWHSGATGGGTGRSADWSTYDGTNDTAWQQWIDDTSTALGTTYQPIKHFKNTGIASSGGFFMGIDNDGTQTIGKWVPDAEDATSAHITVGNFHNLGSDQVTMVDNGSQMILTSSIDSGSIVVFDQALTDSGKVSGYATDLPTTLWDCVLTPTTVSSGGSGSTYDYTGDYWHSKADLMVWIHHDGSNSRTQISHAVWLKGTYTAQGSASSGRDGINELITTPSQSPAMQGSNINSYGDTLDDGWNNMAPQIHWMRNHYEADDPGKPYGAGDKLFSGRQTERFFISNKLWNNSSTATNNQFQMTLMEHYMYNGSAGGGTGGNPWAETTYRSNSDVGYYKPTGRSINNVNTDNTASMVLGKSVIQLYNDESGVAGGNLYVTAMTDTTETASTQLQYAYPDAIVSSHEGGGVAEMFIFDDVTADDTHSTNALIVSNTPATDSTNTSFDPEAICLGRLHGNYFAVAWRQGTTAYTSIFELQEQTSTQPTIVRVADTINLGTVPNAGRMAISKLGNGVAVLACGNYYRIIKTDAI